MKSGISQGIIQIYLILITQRSLRVYLYMYNNIFMIRVVH